MAPQPGVVERRLGVSHVLRAIAREGVSVRIRSTAGDFRGRVVRVGIDHLDAALDLVPQRATGEATVVTIAFGGLLVVEST